MMTVLTSDRCWPRAKLQEKGIGHLNHLLLGCWYDGLCLIRAAKDHRDVKSKPAGQEAESTKCERVQNNRFLHLSLVFSLLLTIWPILKGLLCVDIYGSMSF